MNVRTLTLSLLGGLLLVCSGASAQTATDLNLGSQLTADTSTVPATYTFSWWGKAGCFYLVKSSPDLVNWTFLPDYQAAGANGILKVQFTFDNDKYFFRVYQLDPNDLTGLVDSDGDGLPDQWELFYFGSLDATASLGSDSDGKTNFQEYQAGTNPLRARTSSVKLKVFYPAARKL